MTPINKQKFLAELGRLLTFMYEEDRLQALREYEDIFDQAGNETAVLQLLVSPTRQAVNLARAYDSKDRRTKADGGDTPAYFAVIDDLRRQAGTLLPAAPVEEDDDDQLSLFDKPDVAETIFDNLEFDTLPETGGDEAPVTLPEEIGLYPDEDRDSVTPPPRVVPDKAAPAEEETNRELDDFSDAVEAFLADFTIRPDGSDSADPLLQAQGSENSEEDAPAAAPIPAFSEDRHDEDRPEPAEARLPAQPVQKDSKPILPDQPAETKKQANAALLILYILIAIPVTLLLVCLLLLPAALCLGLAGAGLCLGFGGLVEAFTAFSVFADILLVFGVSLALMAFGLLFLWFFVWFLAGAIPGLIRGVCALARKLCYREVTV